jgi:hypothetical protein
MPKSFYKNLITNSILFSHRGKKIPKICLLLFTLKEMVNFRQKLIQL